MVGWGVAVEASDACVAVGVAVETCGMLVALDAGVGGEPPRWPGMNNSCPMESRSLDRLFSSMTACTVVLCLRAIPLRVSPGATTYRRWAGVGVYEIGV
jgi:hypothetical protein